MCVGIDNCSKKNCLEQERCVFPVRLSLKFKINGPEVLGKVDLSKISCQKDRRFCINQRACEILGQCLLKHNSVSGNRKATREFKNTHSIADIVAVFEKILPARKWKTSKRK